MGFLGTTGRGDKERVLPSVSMASWSAWGSLCLRMDEKLTESIWVRITERAGKGDVKLGVCYRPPYQEDRAGEAVYKEIGAVIHSLALVLMGGLQPPQYWLEGQHSRA